MAIFEKFNDRSFPETALKAGIKIQKTKFIALKHMFYKIK